MNIRHLLPMALLLLSACGLPIKNDNKHYENVVLCNEIHGQLLDHGKPMVGVAIQRSVKWSFEREPRIDIAITDNQGRYAFPEVRGSSKLNILTNVVPHMGSVYTIEFDHQGQNHLIHTSSLGGVTEPLKQPIQFISELATRNEKSGLFWINPQYLNKPKP